MATILIAGGTGLLGIQLSRILRGDGHTVFHLSRRPKPDAEFPSFAWNIEKWEIDKTVFSKADYIINLAGSGIADARWSDARKKDIIQSRTHSTRLLKKYLQEIPHQVKAYISASAIGYYGERGDEILTESSKPGKGFLAESTLAWEEAIREIAETGIRTVFFRIGIVLSTKGGALEKMLIPFTFRSGVYFGNGKQWYSWIHIDDLSRMFVWAIDNEKASGAYNAVSPTPLSNYDLTQAIAEAKGSGYILIPAPAIGLRLAMGEMADVVLNSTRVSSEKIEKQEFKFQFPNAIEALKDLFNRKI